MCLGEQQNKLQSSDLLTSFASFRSCDRLSRPSPSLLHWDQRGQEQNHFFDSFPISNNCTFRHILAGGPPKTTQPKPEAVADEGTEKRLIFNSLSDFPSSSFRRSTSIHFNLIYFFVLLAQLLTPALMGGQMESTKPSTSKKESGKSVTKKNPRESVNLFVDFAVRRPSSASS